MQCNVMPFLFPPSCSAVSLRSVKNPHRVGNSESSLVWSKQTLHDALFLSITHTDTPALLLLTSNTHHRLLIEEAGNGARTHRSNRNESIDKNPNGLVIRNKHKGSVVTGKEKQRIAPDQSNTARVSRQTAKHTHT